MGAPLALRRHLRSASAPLAALSKVLALPYPGEIGDVCASSAFSNEMSLELSMRHRKSMYLSGRKAEENGGLSGLAGGMSGAE